jgi:hypothetical protein
MIHRANFILVSLILSAALPSYAVAGGVPTFNLIGLRTIGSDEASSSDDSGANAAFTGVDNARDQLHRVAIQMLREFEGSPDYQQARLAALQAFSAYEVARADALDTVRASQSGLAAQVRIDRLESQLDNARLEAKLAGRDRSDKTDALAMQLLDERSALSRAEAQAIAADQKVSGLRYAWLDANANLQTMRDGFAQRVCTDPKWRNAKTQLEQARGALASVGE